MTFYLILSNITSCKYHLVSLKLGSESLLKKSHVKVLSKTPKLQTLDTELWRADIYIFKWTVPFPACNGFEGKDPKLSCLRSPSAIEPAANANWMQHKHWNWKGVYLPVPVLAAVSLFCSMLYNFFLFFLPMELCARFRRCQAQICNRPVIKGAYLPDPHRPVFHIMLSWLISGMHFKHQKLTCTLPHNKKTNN